MPLLKQTQDALIGIGPELAPLIGVYGGGSKQLETPINIVTYNAWVDLLESGRLNGANIGFHVSDEAHYALSERRQDLFHDALSDTIHFGVTATSQYDLLKSLERTHENLIYKLGLREAIERGLLADYVHVQYAIMRLLPATADTEGAELSNGDYNLLKRVEWSRLVTHAYANGMDTITGQPLSDKIGIIFTADTKHADFTANMLNKNAALQEKAKRLGFDDVAVAIHSRNMSPTVQAQMQEKFEAGRYMVAVGDKKFKVGFDYSRIKFESSYPGDSVVDAIQEIGRTTRPHADPETGQPEGAVIFEAIPYIGHNNVYLDARSKRSALANCISAYEVLGQNIVFNASRAQSKKSEHPPEPRSFSLSPGCTVEMFITEEDSLTITNMIDRARTDQERIDVTPEMAEALKHEIFRRGNLVPRELVSKINEFEQANGYESVGITVNTIGGITYRLLKSMELRHWERLNEVLQLLPLSHADFRIPITSVMMDELRGKIESRGGLGSIQIIREIEKFERENEKPKTDISEQAISALLYAGVKSFYSDQWQRMNEALDSLPVREDLRRIAVTPEMKAELRDKIEAKGGFGSIKLLEAITAYEIANALTPIGIGERFIVSLVSDRYRSANLLQWLRLNDVLEQLPEQDRRLIDLTPEMLISLQEKVERRGNYGGVKILRKLEEFEANREYASTDLTGNSIGDLLRSDPYNPLRQRVRIKQWERLLEVVDSLPETEITRVKKSARVKIDPAMLADLKRRHVEHGSPTRPALLDAIRQHEKELGLKPTSVNQSTLTNLFLGNVGSVDPAVWQRLNAVIDSYPLADTNQQTAPVPNASETVKQEVSSPVTISDEFIARIAEAVFAKIQAQQPSSSVEHVTKIVQPEAISPKVPTVRRRRIKADKMREPTSENIQVAADETQNLNRSQQTRNSAADQLKLYDIPVFHKTDARGDSMFSCLKHAQRASEANDQVGVKGNLRKFTEFLLHNSIININSEAVVAPLNLSASDSAELDDIVRGYSYSCAQQGQSCKKRGFIPKEQRVELGDRLTAFYKATRILGKYDPENFPRVLFQTAQDIAMDGSDLHYQLSAGSTRTVEEAMQNGLYLANWFKGRFVDLKPAEAEPVTSSVQISEPVPTSDLELNQAKPELSTTLLKVFGLWTDPTKGEGNEAAISHIAEMAAQWADEPASMKMANNRSIQQAYETIKPGIEAMLNVGASVEQMAQALNEKAPASFSWTAATILRGAVLTMSQLPIEAFAVPIVPNRAPVVRKPSGPKAG